MELNAKEFSDRGILPMRGFLPKTSIAAARESILAELERLKIRVKGKFSSSKIQSLPIFQQTGRLAQMIKPKDTIARLFSPDLLSMMQTLAGAPLLAATPQPQVLLSLPHKNEWSLKNLNWHLDLTPPQADHVPGIQAFILINDIQPRGGATLALAGSHRLHYASREYSAHTLLKNHITFASTPEKFYTAHDICGTKIQITEMHGQAGDIFLMDLRVLHSPSVNSRPDIRMMATNRFLLTQK